MLFMLSVNKMNNKNRTETYSMKCYLLASQFFASDLILFLFQTMVYPWIYTLGDQNKCLTESNQE